jgi:hypothetical protein
VNPILNKFSTSFFCVLVSIFFISLSSFSANAGELSLSVGQGSSRWSFKDGELTPAAYRIAYIHPTDWEWSFASDHTLRVELELAAHHWRDPFLEKSKTGVIVNPMWRYYIPVMDQELYFGIGIGLAYTNDDKWMDRQLGSRLLFEDKFEFGVKLFKRHRISVSINHYSNAKLADINHGANVQYINYAYQF